MPRIVILGAGTGGTIMANRIAKAYRGDLAAGEMTLTVVDQDDQHIYQPGLLFVPFGIYQPEDLIRPRRPTPARPGHHCRQDRLGRADANAVHLEDGRTPPYDLLIVATGTRILPRKPRLTGPAGRRRCRLLHPKARQAGKGVIRVPGAPAVNGGHADQVRYAAGVPVLPTGTSPSGDRDRSRSATRRRWTAPSPSRCATTISPTCWARMASRW
jgi:NADPH-dependent 2,4-dienoyl-CoA reductase/sulfur reductase-like enzyme